MEDRTKKKIIPPLRTRKSLLSLMTAGALTTGALALGTLTPGTGTAAKAASPPGPCDIYQQGHTNCMAAYSTTRALYAGYEGGRLYQVTPNNGTPFDVLAGPDGYADPAKQESTCKGSVTCTITIIYDQSPNHNNLTVAPAGDQGLEDHGADAMALPVMVHGHKVYGVDIEPWTGPLNKKGPGTGYRIQKALGVARGDEEEGEYAVLSGWQGHYNNKCCFDFGNAEASSSDTGDGHMEAINFGTAGVKDAGAGGGPWIMADLENGLFPGKDQRNDDQRNANNTSMPYPFVTAMLKGKPHTFALRGGNAQSGPLSNLYEGPRPHSDPNHPTDPSAPSTYDPMHKEGGIVLGIGGDNSNRGKGHFFEGAITAGYPSPETENQVQANIAAAGYAPYVPPASPAPAPPPASTPPPGSTPPPAPTPAPPPPSTPAPAPPPVPPLGPAHSPVPASPSTPPLAPAPARAPAPVLGLLSEPALLP